MVLRSVIVEDESSSRDRLRRLLRNHEDVAVVVGEADSGPEAVRVIHQHEPDLVFLDVSLPGFDGFEVLTATEPAPSVIFTTAHDEHAVRAFRASAIDYLLKPIVPEELASALAKAVSIHSTRRSNQWDEVISAIRAARQQGLRRIACRVGDSTIFVTMDEVLYFRAELGYTTVKTATRELLIDTPLVELENRLDPSDFVRIHRNTLVNMSHVASLKRGLDGRLRVVLKNGCELESSRRYADNVRRWA
jgi:two-component system LytT family response regulator